MGIRWRSLLAFGSLAASIGCASSTPPSVLEPDNIDVTPRASTSSGVGDRPPMHATPAQSGTDGPDPRGPKPRPSRDHDADADGIPDDVDLCPTMPEGGKGDPRDGCPQVQSSGPDRDGDGIDDANDRCPDEFEDMDGFDDQDGCPDLDNDKDGIPDASDKCPSAPETRNGRNDSDGCPD